MTPRIKIRRRRTIVGFEVVPVRRVGDTLHIDRRRGQGLRDLAGWRVILPRLYVVVLFRSGHLLDREPR